MKYFRENYANINFNEFNGKRILITGATGFVGNRLAEILSAETKSIITCVVNNYGNAYKLSRYKVDIIKGNILSAEGMDSACKNIDIIIHCAYGNKGSEKERNDTNIIGVENLCKAAIKNKVERFIFLSTVMTYALPETGYLDEQSKKTTLNESYAVSKLAAEQIVNEYIGRGLAAVILQPTAIYGPWAPSYVMRIFKQTKNYKIPIIDGGNGICNAVYIDDLIQAILLVALNKNALNNTYLVNGDDYITWGKYYHFFAEVTGEEITVAVDEKALRALIKVKKAFLPAVLIKAIRVDTAYLKNMLASGSTILKIYRLFPLSIRKKIHISKAKVADDKQSIPVKKVLPVDADYISFHKKKFKVNNGKLKADVKYSPMYSFDDGFKKIGLFYKWFYSDVINS